MSTAPLVTAEPALAPLTLAPIPADDPVAGHRPGVLTFGPRRGPGAVLDDDLSPRPTPIGELGDPGPFAAGLVRNILEVLDCERPLSRLMRWMDHDIYQSLGRRVAIRSRQRRPGTLRKMVVIRRLRVCRVGPSAVEVAVVAAQGERVRAIAMRLEALDHRWRCTALEIG